jgi:excisionase family DNA binding protein
MTIDTEQVFTLQECSEYLKLPTSTLYLLARTRKIPSVKVGKHWRFSRPALDLWLTGQSVKIKTK